MSTEGRTVLVTRRGLAAAVPEIGRVMADRDGVSFRAQGTCMFPTIRPGDVLSIRSCLAADVAVGDIAVCRNSGYLFGHRVIATGERGGRAYVVTRADRADGAGDAPAFDDDLLGVVTRITRRGVVVPLRIAPASWPERGRQRLILRALKTMPSLRAWVADAFLGFQQSPLYRSVAGRVVCASRLHATFVVRVPLNESLGEAVVRELSPASFDPDVPWHGRLTENWTLLAQVGAKRSPAGWMTYTLEGGEWRAGEVLVRTAYRGTGLDEALRREAQTIVRGSR